MSTLVTPETERVVQPAGRRPGRCTATAEACACRRRRPRARHPRRQCRRWCPQPGLAGLRAAGPDDRSDRVLALLVRRVPGAARRRQRDDPRPGGGHRPAGRSAGHHGRPGAGGLPGWDRGVHRGPRDVGVGPPELLYPDHGVHRSGGAARPGRDLRRHGRHPRAGGDLRRLECSLGDRHRRLPQRGARQAGPDRPLRRRGDECGADDRGRPLHLLPADPQARAGAQWLRGVDGSVREHDPGRHHDRRGRAPAGAQRPPRGLARARDHALADRPPGGAADRASRPGDRRSARRRPGDRRDVAGAPGRRGDQRAQLGPHPQPPAVAAVVRLHRHADADRQRDRARLRCRCRAPLLLVVVVLFGLARILGGRPPGHVSRRKLRRLARQRQARATRLESEPVR